ncbi:MAG: type II toxin-antitoxin system prevent-host-death family antitoxin [Phyllobacteriaceae bacterium]|nr:type II toxin-antitoxin system prevent-host-death family antitoxin [Phyllobacteriaceae bacterium]
MKTMQATEAKNRFGELLEMSATEPVLIQKNGRDLRVLLNVEEYEKLVSASGVDQAVQTSLERSMKRWGRVYEALAK